MLAELDLKALFASQDALALFLAFFIPGFIAKKIYGLSVAEAEEDFSKQLPEVIAYSAIHYALFGWILFVPAPPVFLSAWPAIHVALAYIVVLVLPILDGPLILLIRDPKTYRSRVLTRNVLSYMRQPELQPDIPWNNVFSTDKPQIARIRLKSNEWVGGYMGPDSFSSTYPNPEQLYISRAWEFDDGGEVVSDSSGVGLLVNGTEISYIEVLVAENED
jgi:hypothetical protein